MLKNIIARLALISPTARLDAELLLAASLKVSRQHLYSHPVTQLTEKQHATLETLLKRREQGEPIAYILGRREFWSLDLEVNSHTLIPRPCTERIVELVLAYLPAKSTCHIIDLGTGSGAIALAIASERPHWQVTASDFSLETLQVAKRNAQHHQLTHINFICSDWYQHLPALQVDAIVSNPPYIQVNDSHLQQGDLRFEPHSALVAGIDGLSALRTLINESPIFLKSEGYLFLEHGFDQGKAVSQLMQTAGYVDIHQYYDLDGHQRVTVGKFLTQAVS